MPAYCERLLCISFVRSVYRHVKVTGGTAERSLSLCLAMGQRRYQAGWKSIKSMVDLHARQSPLQIFLSSVGDPSAAEEEQVDVGQTRQMRQAAIGRPEYRERSRWTSLVNPFRCASPTLLTRVPRRKRNSMLVSLFKMRQPCVGDLSVVEEEHGEFSQPFQMRQSGVRDLRFAEVEDPSGRTSPFRCTSPASETRVPRRSTSDRLVRPFK